MSNRDQRRQAHIDQLAGYESGHDAPLRATEAALAQIDDEVSSIVLVEGISDQIAIETLAERLGRSLSDEGVVVLPMGGAHGVKHFVAQFADDITVRLSGLCDRGESDYLLSVLANHGLGSEGFFVCDTDLEDELIRSLLVSEIEAVLQAEGDLGAFRTFQKQAVWSDQPVQAQMHRWLGSVARRKSRYARSFVLAASPDKIPRPLLGLVEHLAQQ